MYSPHVGYEEVGYLKLCQDVLANGQKVMDRTGVGTRSLFSRQLRFDLRTKFPLLTTKRLHTVGIVHELLWFLSGGTNIKYLQDNGVKIWDEWADADGELGPVYGKQWRSWEAPDGRVIDQITNVVYSLLTNPHSRRHIVSAWNPADIDSMALPPCHALFQFYVRELSLAERDNWYIVNKLSDVDINVATNGKYVTAVEYIAGHRVIEAAHKNHDGNGVPRYYLDCHLYQRSGDIFLGIPYNIASYSLLTNMIAQQVGMIAGEFVLTIGDAHIYENHIEQVNKQLTRSINRGIPTSPRLLLEKASSIFDYKIENVQFHHYNPHGVIKAPIAV